jgi:FAD/FMN-containing dehydrogenase
MEDLEKDAGGKRKSLFPVRNPIMMVASRHRRAGRSGAWERMNPASSTPPFATLAACLEGDLLVDDLTRTIYSTDASEYQERPLAVAFPKTEADVRELVRFAAEHRIGLIPRAAGTSLAGQVVGGGIVVDAGRHLNRIVAVDVERHTVRVQPGVVRNALNQHLVPLGLFFGPETSTAAWAMLGGMVGNNS